MLDLYFMLEKTLPQLTIQYLNRVLGGEAVRVKPSRKTAPLPYFLQDTYEVLCGELLGQPITLACVKNQQPMAAHQMGLHAQRLRELLYAPVIIALPNVTPGERKQLIALGVAFVVPNRQLFAPQVGVILTERFRAEPPRVQEQASPATQALLIWFLNHHPVTEIWHPFDDAATLGYTDMTATRAIRELLQFNLFALEVRGRAKYLRLHGTRRELWEKAKPYLRTPVLRTLWTYDRGILDMTGALWAGESALARLTMVNESQQQFLAMTAQTAQHAKQKGILFEPRDIADGVAVQVWRYRPDLDAKKKTVDRLSLWLSLRDHRDDRIQMALDELEENFEW